MFYTVYCTNCVLNKIGGVFQSICSFVALLPLKYVFFPIYEDLRKFGFFEMLTFLGPCVEKILRDKGRKLDTASLLFLCIGESGCVIY